MLRVLFSCVTLFFVSVVALGDETEDAQDAKDAAAQPKEMSGMSILGNEETPKSLVIVPWKSSELGADLSISNTLDDRARPVDKEIFLRELRYYTIRSSD
jgi:hypothetical protein